MPATLCLSCAIAKARPTPYSSWCRDKSHAHISRAAWEDATRNLEDTGKPPPTEPGSP